MATRLVTVVFLSGIALTALAGCAAEDDVVFIAYNAAADPNTQCDINPQLIQSPGWLDLADSYRVYPTNPNIHLPSPKSYMAYFLIRTNGVKVTYNTSETRAGGPSVYNYGGTPTQDVLIEEVETRYEYDFNIEQPATSTTAAIPSQNIQPAIGWVGPETKAGRSGQYAGTSLVAVNLMPAEVAAAFSSESTLFDATKTYQISVGVRLRGRNVGGSRLQTEWASYPLWLCRDCMVARPACYFTCYDPWQDC